MSYVNTIFPGFIPQGYFDEDNMVFIQQKIIHVLGLEFKQKIIVDRASIVRVMQRVLEERLESIPKMNQRVIMYITNEFRNHQLDANKHLKWEAHFVASQRLHDESVGRSSIDLYDLKLANRLGKSLVGGTTRFYFT